MSKRVFTQSVAREMFSILLALEQSGLFESMINQDEACRDEGDAPVARPLVQRARDVIAYG